MNAQDIPDIQFPLKNKLRDNQALLVLEKLSTVY